MEFIFQLTKNIEEKTYMMNDDEGLKPVFYYLKHFSDWHHCQIYVNRELVWKITNYGRRVYIVRYLNEAEIMRCSIVDGMLDGCVYLYDDGRMAYILKYNNSNLHGPQVRLSQSYFVTAKHGEFIKGARTSNDNNEDIKSANKLVLSLLKWI